MVNPGTAALCIGMSKTGVQGMMLLIVPYMAMAFGAKESPGVILPMLCMADIMAVAYYKRIADWKVVAKLLPTALLGFLVALFVDKFVPAQGFRQLMGWTLALAMAVMIWSEIFGKENRWMHKWWYSALFGLFGGFTTMIGNAAGPVMSVSLLNSLVSRFLRDTNGLRPVNEMRLFSLSAMLERIISLLYRIF